ncbi:3,4-dihydroxy-2-butanone-4-phosphate synthase [Pigmentibacter sp. JX0631]|uniref:3,4-dihydroxy-2-butanone-4-phosphate synthase n=1 Tax=Pigmentibacter sp. JX0631 TaxID=2976982 RepID=UPI002468DE8E|nr:3,4-dihydroxy-2-butanone-4-phosphate synthase [Pigmentibacter sp. JX0631]WGL60403.1 3,4-dihydroxy-2-butanone-4-phosphate synthase [Pigmentibacter sp. JX0631]
MNYSEQYLYALTTLVEKIQKALATFKSGGLILVGDDGRRENEADLVFHACGASPENVNFAITHAKGLLCVSLSHEVANNLGIYSAPQIPGGISHTNFTLSVDAKKGITSGISAKDRAYTIELMADPKASIGDFVSPGHVFPLRAMQGGLLARAGHTEALLELCNFANLPSVAAMCEVLDENGNAINPKHFADINHKYNVFKDIPYITTIDILWAKIFFQPLKNQTFHAVQNFTAPEIRERPISVFEFQQRQEKELTLPTFLCVYKEQINPEKIHISITNAANIWNNSVELNNCDAAVFLYCPGNCFEKIPSDFSDFCDMSAKEGLSKTKISVKRCISILRTMQFISTTFNLNINQIINNTPYLVPEDKYFLSNIVHSNFKLY